MSWNCLEQVVDHLQSRLDEFPPEPGRVHPMTLSQGARQFVLMKSPTRTANVSRQGTGSDCSGFVLRSAG